MPSMVPDGVLSLEWQFYLLAPFVIGLCFSVSSLLVLVVVTISLSAAYHAGLFGSFPLPSFLPGAAWYFAAGITARFFIESVTTTRFSKLLFKACGILFSNRVALYFGARSYSTYLIHWPILCVLTWAAVGTPLAQSKTTCFLYLIVAGTPLIILASEFLYRFVERPGNRLGARLAAMADFKDRVLAR